jgi:hypothetical protein
MLALNTNQSNNQQTENEDQQSSNKVSFQIQSKWILKVCKIEKLSQK